MNKENKKKTAQKDAKRQPSRIAQILIVLLVLGFLWVVGKSVFYIFNLIGSRL